MTKSELSFFEQELEALLKHESFELNLVGSNLWEIYKEITYAFKRLLQKYSLIDPNNRITILKEDYGVCFNYFKNKFKIEIPETKEDKNNVISLDIDDMLKMIKQPIYQKELKKLQDLKQDTLRLLPDFIYPYLILPHHFIDFTKDTIKSTEDINSLIFKLRKEMFTKFKKFLECIGKGAARYAYMESEKHNKENHSTTNGYDKSKEYKSIEEFEKLGSLYIREMGYKYGHRIYYFMEKYNIGKSYYGKIMDIAAHGKGVIAHRLYGHHFVYDIPLDNPRYILQFYEHLFSDLFTRQGLPILPGEVLKDIDLLKACDKLTKSWNFINGFDILTATVSLYSAIPKFYKAIKGSYTINSVEQLAKEMGVGALELAIAMSSTNPFLLVASSLELTSVLKGIFNKGDRVFFNALNNSLSISFSISQLTLDSVIEGLSLDTSIEQLSVENSLRSLIN